MLLTCLGPLDSTLSALWTFCTLRIDSSDRSLGILGTVWVRFGHLCLSPTVLVGMRFNDSGALRMLARFGGQ
jgi:hypothetical protein